MTTLTGHLTEAQAQRLLDGELDPVRDAEVAAHVEGCAGCAALVESFQALGEALDGLDTPALPAGFTEGVLARIEVTEAAAARERRVAALVFAGVVLAAGLALVVAVSGGLVPAITGVADRLGDASRALRFGREVLPGVVSALRFHLLAGAAAAGLPLLYALTRLMPATRPQRV